MLVMECLHTAAWYHTTLRNKDRISDSTFPTLPERRGLGPRTDESSWTSHIKPHTLGDINPWETRETNNSDNDDP